MVNFQLTMMSNGLQGMLLHRPMPAYRAAPRVRADFGGFIVEETEKGAMVITFAGIKPD